MYTIIKLHNGSEIIGVLLDDKDDYLMQNPFQIFYLRDKTISQRPQISVQKFMPLSKEKTFVFRKEDVLTLSTPIDGIQKYYDTALKYYDDAEIKPTVAIVLQQIINSNINSSIRELYVKGKVYELLSLHFQKDETTEGEYCPFLVDEDNVLKIRRAKEIIISRMAEPPSLQELANEIGLNLKKLKEGFKQIYGDTVYSFLFDYKMEHARRLLESNKFNVNEVGVQIGYSTASHFIAAFKKKFGTTPKKYVMSLNK